MKKGDIVLIPFPFTNLSGAKQRPALVLHATPNFIVVVFITSRLKWKEQHDVVIEPTDENGLKKRSLIRCAKIATLDKELASGLLGKIGNENLSNVNDQLKDLLELD